MIKKECLTTEWIRSVAEQTQYKDLNLIEKVIRALSLLEMLQNAGCPFCFKGGSALMLILGQSPHRLSIDIDIICPPGTDIEPYLKDIEKFGFISKTLEERQQRDSNIPKSHSKFFYHIAYKDGANKESYILLDVLYEDLHYQQTNEVDIVSPFIQHDGTPLKVMVPSVDDILGDKLTAFAPNTTGIPYLKGDRDCSLEIIKQLYDVGRLFEYGDNFEITAEAFKKIGVVELEYRKLAEDLELIYDDIRETALCLATRGVLGNGDFKMLQSGVKKLNSLIYMGNYHIEHAITDAAKAVYMVTLIEIGKKKVERYNGDPLSVVPLELASSVSNKLNKLKKTLPEAYFYWVKTSELLENRN